MGLLFGLLPLLCVWFAVFPDETQIWLEDCGSSCLCVLLLIGVFWFACIYGSFVSLYKCRFDSATSATSEEKIGVQRVEGPEGWSHHQTQTLKTCCKDDRDDAMRVSSRKRKATFDSQVECWAVSSNWQTIYLENIRSLRLFSPLSASAFLFFVLVLGTLFLLVRSFALGPPPRWPLVLRACAVLAFASAVWKPQVEERELLNTRRHRTNEIHLQPLPCTTGSIWKNWTFVWDTTWTPPVFWIFLLLLTTSANFGACVRFVSRSRLYCGASMRSHCV